MRNATIVMTCQRKRRETGSAKALGLGATALALNPLLITFALYGGSSRGHSLHAAAAGRTNLLHRQALRDGPLTVDGAKQVSNPLLRPTRRVDPRPCPLASHRVHRSHRDRGLFWRECRW